MQLQIRDTAAHDRAVRRGRTLEYLTVGWNLAEAAIAISAGAVAGSTALVGFGIDSMIESLSGGVMLWRLQSGKTGLEREKIALRLVGVSLILLAVYVAIDAGWSLYASEAPDESLVGICLAIVSLIVMPILARAKRKVAVQLNSRSMQADSKQTDICAYLSAILLAGLALNSIFGWWWADPIAALIMVPIIAKEGVGALRGESCGCSGDCH